GMHARQDDIRVGKWGCWALVHLTFNHPPNKKEVVQRGSIPLVVNVLNTFSSDESVTHQGLALMLNLLSPDPQAKMSLSDARQMALTHGIVDTLQTAEKRFHGSDSMQQLCKTIQENLMLEWS
ncbi:unnamed protein product, partial [Symbiodinium microadriaticum]